MSEEKEAEKKTITLKVTLPTRKTIVDTLSKLFPGIEVEVEEEKPTEETPSEE